MCDDIRQESILLSDVFGVSMLTVATNNDKPLGCTQAVFGPFPVEGAPHYANGDDVINGASGARCRLRSPVKDLNGKLVAGAWICHAADGGGAGADSCN